MGTENSPNIPLRSQLMWEDVLTRKNLLNNYHRSKVVDLSLSILSQKLTYLQFCIAVKDENILYNPYGDSLFLQRRLPLTADAIAQRKYILEKLKPVSTDTDSVLRVISPLCASTSDDFQDSREGEVEVEVEVKGEINISGLQAVVSSPAETNHGASDNGGQMEVELEVGDKEKVGVKEEVEGELNKELSKLAVVTSNDLEQATTTNTNTTTISITDTDLDGEAALRSLIQYWKIEYDVVISDMRAWKEENITEGADFQSESSFDEFVEWYTGRDVESGEGDGYSGGDRDGRYDSNRADLNKREYYERRASTVEKNPKDILQSDFSADTGGDYSSMWESVSPSLQIGRAHV